jgi:hypothetical protein
MFLKTIDNEFAQAASSSVCKQSQPSAPELYFVLKQWGLHQNLHKLKQIAHLTVGC